MQLAVEVWDIFKTFEDTYLVPLDLFLLVNIEPVEGNGQQARIALHNGFVEDGPAVGVANLSVAALFEEEVDALEVLFLIGGQLRRQEERCVPSVVYFVQVRRLQEAAPEDFKQLGKLFLEDHAVQDEAFTATEELLADIAEGHLTRARDELEVRVAEVGAPIGEKPLLRR